MTSGHRAPWETHCRGARAAAGACVEVPVKVPASDSGGPGRGGGGEFPGICLACPSTVSSFNRPFPAGRMRGIPPSSFLLSYIHPINKHYGVPRPTLFTTHRWLPSAYHIKSKFLILAGEVLRDLPALCFPAYSPSIHSPVTLTYCCLASLSLARAAPLVYNIHCCFFICSTSAFPLGLSSDVDSFRKPPTDWSSPP